MAVRIYALAKELKLDSKELVDICTKAGVPGKGSALASLTEEEVEKVKQFLKGGGAKGQAGQSSAATSATADRAGAHRQDAGDCHVEAAQSHRRDQNRPNLAPEPVPSESTLAATSTATETATATAVAVETARRPGPLAGAMGREKYIGPGQMGGKVPVVGKESTAVGSQEDRRRDRHDRTRAPGGQARADAENFATVEPAAPNEPPAQKPDLRLPADILGAGKQGSKPLAAHLRRHERTLDEEKKQRGAVKGPRVPLAPVPTEEEARKAAKARGRRGKETPAEGEGEEDRPMLGGREQRQLARRRNATHGRRRRPAASLASAAGSDARAHRRQHGRAAQRARHRSIALHGPRAVRGRRRAGQPRFCAF